MSWLLAASYAAVAALLLNLGLRSRWPWWVKLGGVVLVSLLYFGTFLGWRAREGWPSTTVIEESFRLLSVHIEEPDRATKSAGAVYYWVQLLDEEGTATGPPRSYRRKFSAAEAAAARRAETLLRRGVPVEGRWQDLAGDRELERPDTSPSRRSEAPGEALEFEEVAPPTLPPKGSS
ncbi:MAG: hypothetical protein AAGA81_11135 [Acidobacteriota bacterium]